MPGQGLLVCWRWLPLQLHIPWLLLLISAVAVARPAEMPSLAAGRLHVLVPADGGGGTVRMSPVGPGLAGVVAFLRDGHVLMKVCGALCLSVLH